MPPSSIASHLISASAAVAITLTLITQFQLFKSDAQPDPISATEVKILDPLRIRLDNVSQDEAVMADMMNQYIRFAPAILIDAAAVKAAPKQAYVSAEDVATFYLKLAKETGAEKDGAE